MSKPLLTKTQLNELIRTGRGHEIFTHSIFGTFDVTLMNKIAPLAYAPFTSDLTADLITHIKASRDWEQERINTVAAEQILQPTLWIHDVADDTHILIDGTHRLIAAFERFKLIKFRGYMATLDNAIRPDTNALYANPAHDWGRMEVRDGKIYDRQTGKEIK